LVKSDGWLDNEDYAIYILRKLAKRQGKPEKGELIKQEWALKEHFVVVAVHC
jgi:hypothetical protein